MKSKHKLKTEKKSTFFTGGVAKAVLETTFGLGFPRVISNFISDLEFLRAPKGSVGFLRVCQGSYSMISIISTGSIKRTGLAIILKFLLNVPYDPIFNHVFLNVLVSIKRTGFDQAKYKTGFKQNI